jgi:hypothetical protein
VGLEAHGGRGVDDALAVEAVVVGRALADGVELGGPTLVGVDLRAAGGARVIGGRVLDDALHGVGVEREAPAGVAAAEALDDERRQPGHVR